MVLFCSGRHQPSVAYQWLLSGFHWLHNIMEYTPYCFFAPHRHRLRVRILFVLNRLWQQLSSTVFFRLPLQHPPGLPHSTSDVMSKYHPFLWRHIEPGEEFFLCFVPELIGKEGNIEALIVVWSLSYLIIVVESNLRKYEKVEIHPQMSSTPKERPNSNRRHSEPQSDALTN